MGGPHAGLLAARATLDAAERAQARGDDGDAYALAERAIDELGAGYGSASVCDDTGQKLAAARDLHERGDDVRAASTAMRMLRVRLALYTREHADAPPDGRGLALSLRLEPSVAAEGEPVHAVVTLTSTGTAPVWVNARLALNGVWAPAPYREIGFEARGPDRAMRPFLARVRIGAPTAEHVRRLEAGATLARRYDLSHYFDLEAPGTYEICAFYASAPVAGAAGDPAWTEPIASDVVRLERKASAAAP